VQKKQYSNFLLFAIEMAILSVTLVKKGLGRLGVKAIIVFKKTLMHYYFKNAL